MKRNITLTTNHSTGYLTTHIENDTPITRALDADPELERELSDLIRCSYEKGVKEGKREGDILFKIIACLYVIMIVLTIIHLIIK